MKKGVILVGMIALFFSSKAQLCVTADASFRGVLGESRAALFGVQGKAIYFMNDWTGAYIGAGAYQSGGFNGQVEVVARNGLISPSSLIKKTNVSASVLNLEFGVRRYLLGDSYGDRKKKYGLYADAQFSLLLAKANSGVPEYDALNYESPVIEETEASFVNYLGGVIMGVDKVLVNNYLYCEVGMGATINQANRFVVDVTWPFYFSISAGMRFNVSNY